MNVVLFGATGMVGQGVLRECLLDPDVKRVLTVGRRATGVQNPKVKEIVHAQLTDFSAIEMELADLDACFFCLGVSSAGMKEGDYSRVTYAVTVAAAEALVRRNPGMTFIYVSGMGTDSSEQGRSMWARVKGRTENVLLLMPFRATYMFRPGLIVPLHGVKSGTKLYRIVYGLLSPILRLVEPMIPKYATTSEKLGRAMLQAAKHGAPTHVLESVDINRLAGAP
jgi:uncharacterized protein YbjT (DUF2867 family)